MTALFGKDENGSDGCLTIGEPDVSEKLACQLSKFKTPCLNNVFYYCGWGTDEQQMESVVMGMDKCTLSSVYTHWDSYWYAPRFDVTQTNAWQTFLGGWYPIDLLGRIPLGIWLFVLQYIGPYCVRNFRHTMTIIIKRPHAALENASKAEVYICDRCNQWSALVLGPFFKCIECASTGGLTTRLCIKCATTPPDVRCPLLDSLIPIVPCLI
jgi:hypothetical protein